MKAESRFTVVEGVLRDREGDVPPLMGCSLSSADGACCSLSSRTVALEDVGGLCERLVSKGVSFLRVPVAWQDIEGLDAGLYDEEYLSYLRDVLKGMEPFGITAFIDPARIDGSVLGVPSWAAGACGIDLESKDAHAVLDSLLLAGGEGSVPGNALTMVEGMSAGDWILARFAEAMAHLARRIKDCAAVAGFALPGRTDAFLPIHRALMGELGKKRGHYVYFALCSSARACDAALVSRESGFPVARVSLRRGGSEVLSSMKGGDYPVIADYSALRL